MTVYIPSYLKANVSRPALFMLVGTNLNLDNPHDRRMVEVYQALAKDYPCFKEKMTRRYCINNWLKFHGRQMRRKRR